MHQVKTMFSFGFSGHNSKYGTTERKNNMLTEGTMKSNWKIYGPDGRKPSVAPPAGQRVR